MKSQKNIKNSYKHMVCYFNKYRKQLENISTEFGIKSRNTVSQKLLSPEPLTPNNLSVFSEAKLPPSVEMPPIVQTPIKVTVKKSPVIVEHEKEKTIKPVQVKEDLDASPRQNETMKQVQLLISELDELKVRITKTDNEKQQKKRTIERLQSQIQSDLFKPPVTESRDYAEIIIEIQSKMKAKKEAHEAELNLLIGEKNQGHFENVELSKLKECYEQQLIRLKEKYRRSEEEQSLNFLQSKVNKLLNQIAKIEKQSDEIQHRIENNQEIRQISQFEFSRYAEVYKKQFIGRQVSNAQDRITNRQSYKRYTADIDRKRFIIKQRKIEIVLREKAISEAKKVINQTNKQIDLLKEELKNLKSERKMTVFKDQI